MYCVFFCMCLYLCAYLTTAAVGNEVFTKSTQWWDIAKQQRMIRVEFRGTRNAVLNKRVAGLPSGRGHIPIYYPFRSFSRVPILYSQ